MRTWAFISVLACAFSGCLSTRPCEEGLVAGDLGCVPADGGVDALREDVPELDATETDDVNDAEPDTCVAATFYADVDGDEHGDPSATMEACSAPAGFVALSDDCDDTTELRYPGLAEICDGLDNDCDTRSDDTFACVQGATTSCTTACGSTGTGACSASCAVPAPADCTPPAESCGGPLPMDEDCDGQVDESLQTFGPRRDLTSVGGGTTGRVVVVSTRDNYFAYFTTAGGIYVQRFDAAGAPVGASFRVTADATDVFDAYATSSQMVVTWVNSSDLLRATVLDESLTVLTAVRDIITVDAAFTTRVSVVRSGSNVLLAYHDGTAIRAVPRSAMLTGSGATFLVANTSRADFETTVDPANGRAYVAYVTSTNAIQVASVLVSGSLEGTVATLSATNPRRAPVPHFAIVAGGTGRLGVTFHENAAGTASDLIRFAIFDVGAAGALAIRETLTLYGGPAPDGVPDPTQITYGGGRWFVPYLRLASPATSSSWWLAQVTEFASGSPRIEQATVETGTSANRSVGASAGLSISGYGPVVLVASSRTDGVGRAYLLSCP